MGITVQNILEWRTVIIKLLSPKIHIQILQTDLHTFPHRISWENLFKDQSIFPWVIILFILINFSFYYVLILLRENWCWSLSSNVRKIPANQGFSRLCSKKNWNEASAVNLWNPGVPNISLLRLLRFSRIYGPGQKVMHQGRRATRLC